MKRKKLKIVLAGQANIGKSVIFNYLTGLHQHTGNWAGKTVREAKGNLLYKGHLINVFDLPGIYSLSTYSIDEIVSRRFIANEDLDFIVNVVDAGNLERNLLFTLQLMELGKPIILVLNMIDLAERKGIKINYKKIERILGIPAIPTIATQGYGLDKIVEKGILLLKNKKKLRKITYGKEVEKKIRTISLLLKNIDLNYPKRLLAIKLLENDKKIAQLIEKKLGRKKNFSLTKKVERLSSELEKIHGHESSIVIANERCAFVSQLMNEVVEIIPLKKPSLKEKLNSLTTDKFFGYLILLFVFAGLFLSVFWFGNWISSIIDKISFGWDTQWHAFFGSSFLSSLGWAGVEGFIALFGIVLPYMLPFYLFLSFLENSGYIARVSFLMDGLMHKMGIHGKSFIPMVLGFGCTVPACFSCRIMETERQRFITAFLTTFIPCTARTVVIFGLLGKSLGIGWAFSMYVLVVLVVFAVGKALNKILPEEPIGFIMDMPDYKLPSLKTLFSDVWMKIQGFARIVTPLIVISGIVIEAFFLFGWLSFFSQWLSPVTVTWLRLPMVAGVLLILGVLRKELILVMLATLFGTTNFLSVLSPVQIITLTVISIFYIPCVATFIALKHEFGWLKAVIISLTNISVAIFLGGIIARTIPLLFNFQ